MQVPMLSVSLSVFQLQMRLGPRDLAQLAQAHPPLQIASADVKHDGMIHHLLAQNGLWLLSSFPFWLPEQTETPIEPPKKKHE